MMFFRFLHLEKLNKTFRKNLIYIYVKKQHKYNLCVYYNNEHNNDEHVSTNDWL